MWCFRNIARTEAKPVDHGSFVVVDAYLTNLLFRNLCSSQRLGTRLQITINMASVYQNRITGYCMEGHNSAFYQGNSGMPTCIKIHRPFYNVVDQALIGDSEDGQ